jgi:Cu(I)/Ag(I) efflux system periplasmic protein CusF
MKKTLRHFASIAVLGLAAAATLPALAQALSQGEVRKVDKENRKVTLKHGEIKNLDMPPMTMVFQVSDAVSLDKLKPGDKVQFAATSEGGKITVTDIRPAQ